MEKIPRAFDLLYGVHGAAAFQEEIAACVGRPSPALKTLLAAMGNFRTERRHFC